MWESRRLTTLWASTACYRDSFTFTFLPEDRGNIFLGKVGRFSSGYMALYPEKMQHFVTIALRTQITRSAVFVSCSTRTIVCQLTGQSHLVLFLLVMKFIKLWRKCPSGSPFYPFSIL
jgi:hypothetical protein